MNFLSTRPRVDKLGRKLSFEIETIFLSSLSLPYSSNRKLSTICDIRSLSLPPYFIPTDFIVSSLPRRFCISHSTLSPFCPPDLFSPDFISFFLSLLVSPKSARRMFLLAGIDYKSVGYLCPVLVDSYLYTYDGYQCEYHPRICD